MESSLGDTQEGPMEYSMLSGVMGQCKRIKGNIVNIASHLDFRPKEGGKLEWRLWHWVKNLWVDKVGKAILCRENIKDKRKKAWVPIMYFGNNTCLGKIWSLVRGEKWQEVGPNSMQGQIMKDLVCHYGEFRFYTHIHTYTHTQKRVCARARF